MPAIWAPPAKYTSQSVRSACGRDAEQKELRRKNSQTSLASSGSVRQLQTVLSTSSIRNSMRRSGSVTDRGGEGRLSQRLFQDAHIPSVGLKVEVSARGDSSWRRAPLGTTCVEARPSKPAREQSLSRLPISGLQASVGEPPLHSGERSPSPTFGGASSSRSAAGGASSARSAAPRQVSPGRMEASSARSGAPRYASPSPRYASPSPRQASPLRTDRSAVAASPARSSSSAAPPTARESPTPRFQFRSRCPDLSEFIAPRDVAVMTEWYSAFERPLSSAFPDAGCPYVWMDPATQGPDLQVLDTFDKPWKFLDFKEEWDHPDLSQFDAWCEECTSRQRENARKAQDIQPYSYSQIGVTSSTCRSREVAKKAPAVRPDPANAARQLWGSQEPQKVAEDWKLFVPSKRPVQNIPTPARAVVAPCQ